LQAALALTCRSVPEYIYALVSMTVPTPIRYAAFFAVILCAASTEAFAKPKKADKVEAHVSLESLGFPGFASRLITEGASTLTVNFVDEKHLLVTFGTRGLVSRHAGEQHVDEDRMVAGLLVELPSGAVVARTEWLMHDHGRYLWPLGHGRFLLRIENNLSTFAPMANLKDGHAFSRVVFAPVTGNVDAVMVATDEKLVMVSTSRPHSKRPEVTPLTTAQAARPHFSTDPHQAPPRITANDPTPKERADEHSAEVLSFYRISGKDAPQDELEVQPAGTAFAESIVSLPVYSDGYLQPVGQDKLAWRVAFHPFKGKNAPLAPIETTCAPNMTRVGPAQFVALTCRGIAGVMLVAYDLAQHEIFDEPLPASDVPPMFAVAGSAGRFAMSRYLVTTDSPPPGSAMTGGRGLGSLGSNSSSDDPTVTTNQDVRIYQTQTGDLLLHTSASPAFKMGENFDLSEDGMRAAVVHDMNIDIYRLPELTKEDKADLTELAPLTPEPSNARISFGSGAGSTVIDVPEEAASPANPPNVVVLGDTNKPAQPPSLLTDGEKAEFPEKPVKKPE